MTSNNQNNKSFDNNVFEEKNNKILNFINIVNYHDENEFNNIFINKNTDKNYYDILNLIFEIKFIINKYNKHSQYENKHSQYENINTITTTPIFIYDFVMYCKNFHKIKCEVYLLESLIHLKTYVEYIKYIILNWNTLNKNEKYNENVYIKICNYSKEINDLIEYGNYYELVNCVLNYIYFKNVDDIDSIYYDEVIKQNIDESDNNFSNMNEIKIKIYDTHFKIVDKIWSSISSDN